jgi:hypothetical protein
LFDLFIFLVRDCFLLLTNPSITYEAIIKSYQLSSFSYSRSRCFDLVDLFKQNKTSIEPFGQNVIFEGGALIF